MNTQPIFGQTRPMRPITTRGGGVILRARHGEALSLDEIAARAPAVFADGKHESRSARYEYTDTRTVLGGLIAEGFLPVEVRQGGSRIAGKANFTKHMVRLTTPGGAFNVEPRVGDISSANVVLVNSHDGTSSYQLRAGFMRWICTNGMQVGDDFETFRIGHTKGAGEKVIDAAFRVVNDFPRAVDQVREMAALGLSQAEQRAFAAAALQLRWAPEVDTVTGNARPAPIGPDDLLRTRRALDSGSDLFLTMNRVQEGLIRGGQSYVRHGQDERGRPTRQNRTVGPVQSIDQDSAINRALFTLATEMSRIKLAA